MSASTTTIQAPPHPGGFAEEWGGISHWVDLDGPVHYVSWNDEAGRRPSGSEGYAASAAGPAAAAVPAAAAAVPAAAAAVPAAAADYVTPILFVHGLGGSHLNWVLVSELAKGHAAYAIDLRGHGLTPGHPADASVTANARLVVRFIAAVVGRPVVLVGNSMGGVVSVLAAQDRPDLVERLVLVDPALPLASRRVDPVVAARFAMFGVPRLAEFAMRRQRQRTSPEQLGREVMELCFADTSRLDPQLMAAAVRLAESRMEMSGVEESFMRAARTLLTRLARRSAWGRVLASLRMPVLLVHGDRDRLVQVASARAMAAANPTWRYVEFAGVGHTPQLEVPEEFVAAVEPFIAR